MSGNTFAATVRIWRRLNCMKHFLSMLDYPDKDRRIVNRPDPLIVGSSAHVVGRSERFLLKCLHPDPRQRAQ
jgi:hypothetical protein